MIRPLVKHTIVIWTEIEEATTDLEDLAREAVSGGGFCTTHQQETIADPLSDPRPPSQEFFDLFPDEDQED